MGWFPCSFLVVPFLAAGLPTCTSKPAPRLEFPISTKHSAWALETIQPWKTFLAHPAPEVLHHFTSWAFDRAKQRDIPTLYAAMSLAWLAISPLGARGAKRQHTPCLVFALLQLALSTCAVQGCPLQTSLAYVVQSGVESYASYAPVGY